MKNSSISAYSALSAAVMATKKNSQDSNNHHYEYQSPEQNGTHISNKSYISGVYRLLIVDDDQIVRKLLKRRISRIFPQAIIDEVDCGEKAIECAYGCSSSTSSSLPLPSSKAIYDIIFIDHFMGDGLTGDQTIKELRDNNVDSLIIGISGNSMESTHISAGAQDFFQKPLPAQSILIQRLIQKLPPPAGWNVLIVDDIKMNCHFLERRLHRISSAHFTTMSQAQQRWQITKTTSASDAIEKIKTDHYDLIVLDQELNDDQGVKGSDIAAFARKHGHCRNGIIALNSASTPDIQYPQFFNMSWTKPLPGEGRMRQTLCEELIRLQY
jgi:CheY-like chemotaxis protein